MSQDNTYNIEGTGASKLPDEEHSEEFDSMVTSMDKSAGDIVQVFPQNKKIYIHIFKNIFNAFVPMTLTLCLSYLPQMISLAYMGHISDQELATTLIAAVGYGEIWQYGSQVFLIMSLGDALCILASKSLGLKDYHLSASYYNKAVFICFLSVIVTSILLLFIGYVWEFFEFEEDVIAYAELYIRLNYITSCIQIFFECGIGYLSAMGIFYPILFCKLVGVASELIFGYIFIIKLDLQILGLSIANWISYTLDVCALYTYAKFSSRVKSECFQKPSVASVKLRLKEFVVTSFGIAAIWYAEMVSLEIISSMSGGLDDEDQVAALVVLFTLTYALSIGALGVSYAGRTYVNKYIGKGYYNKLRLFVIILYGFGVVTSIVEIILVAWSAKWMASLFSESDVIVEYLVTFLHIYLLNIFNENINQSNSMILKSFGRERYCLMIYIFCFYGVSIPLAYYLAYHTWLESYGIVIAMTVADTLCDFILLLTILLMNWKYYFKLAKQHLMEEHNMNHDKKIVQAL